MKGGRVEFHILGPVEVEDDGRVLPLRGPRQRALLAMLLISANEVVSDDRLFDELWGDAPPASGRTALRVRVSQLRKSLGSALVTRPPGYMLSVDPDCIDGRRFERLVESGRAAADPAQAASVLRDALALWRGPALADVATEPFARAEAERLEELRLAALELRIEAELALGRHVELVPELQALVAELPRRERFRAHLMVALYRSGRQARALEVYREGRERLVSELGLEPGPQLRELEAAILRQDASLRLPDGHEPRDERRVLSILAVAPAQAGLAEEIAQAGGTPQLVGEQMVVAVFGAPHAQEDHADRALRTARALVHASGLRAGVETGECVVSGEEGSQQVSGTALQAAMRLARRAAPGTVLAGDRAVVAAGGGQPSRLQRRGELVGRSRELEQLLSAYRAAVTDGTARLVTVVGAAGVGKSRLVSELLSLLEDAEPAPVCRSGRCLAHGRGLTYRPLADIVREHLGLLESDSEETIRARLAGREVLGLALGLDAPPELHPLVARDRLQQEWVSLICEVAGSSTPVLLVEDLHWAQEPLLDLLERLLDECACPLLLVCTARPELGEARPTWGRRRDADTIWLDRLAEQDAERLLGGFDVGIPEELRVPILVRAEGNPFFLEELALAVARHDEPVSAIPDTVQAVLAARIDLLPPLEKSALQAAAVIGRVFWQGSIEALLDRAALDFALLEANDFVRPRPTSSLAGDREYVFKHALTRDVAYASLTDDRRRALHASFASWLEETGGGRDEHAAFLAHHYALAAEGGRLAGDAVAWLRRAAELAIGRYELEEALALLGRALELADEPSTRLALFRLVGRANALRHDGEPFLDAMMRAIELSTDDETTAELYADLSFETALRAGMWRRRPDRELVDGWIDHALELAGPMTRSRARALIARCVWAPADNAEAAREASAIAEALDDVELRSYALDARGITAWVSGERDLGRAFEERRFELLDRIHDPDHMADINYAPVSGCVWLGHFEEARRLARRHDEITRGLTAHHRVHGVAVLVEVEELTGSWQLIRDELEPRAESSILANLETPCVRSPRSLYVMAIARHVLGDPEGASRLEEVADGFEMSGYGHVLETPRLQLALLRGELETVERLVSTPLPDRGWHRGWMLLSTEAIRLDALAALGRRAEVEAWPRERPGTYVEPFRLRALGRVREDEDLVEQALQCFERLRLPWFAEQTRAVLV